MADLGLSDIASDPNYVNANAATKKAIFDKYSAQDQNYTGANPATQAAIRKKFGIADVDQDKLQEGRRGGSSTDVSGEGLKKGDTFATRSPKAQGLVEPEGVHDQPTDLESVFTQKSDLEKKLKAAESGERKDIAAELIAAHCAAGGIAIVATHEPLGIACTRLTLGAA